MLSARRKNIEKINKMTNYISINGNKIELTDEQVQQIKKAGIVNDNPFRELKNGQRYFYIESTGTVSNEVETRQRFDDERYLVANYCTDKKLMEQRALHETLNRLLWRFSMTHGGEEIVWGNGGTNKFRIYFDCVILEFKLAISRNYESFSEIYFKDEKTAKQAIEEIIKPFIKEHPEFVW